MNFKNWSVLIIILIVIAFLVWFFIAKGHRAENDNKSNFMKMESTVFENNGNIPVLYTCNGQGTQPPLQISDVPQNAKSLALIVDDLDAPSGDFVHWVVWNIDPKIRVIENGNVPNATEGNTSLGKPGWVAPCPSSGTHHYNFKLYALDIVLSIPASSTKNDLISVMNEHVIDNAMLVGLYGRGN